MTIAIDFVGTNLGSGTKTYNINFCNELTSIDLTQVNELTDETNLKESLACSSDGCEVF